MEGLLFGERDPAREVVRNPAYVSVGGDDEEASYHLFAEDPEAAPPVAGHGEGHADPLLAAPIQFKGRRRDWRKGVGVALVAVMVVAVVVGVLAGTGNIDGHSNAESQRVAESQATSAFTSSMTGSCVNGCELTTGMFGEHCDAECQRYLDSTIFPMSARGEWQLRKLPADLPVGSVALLQGTFNNSAMSLDGTLVVVIADQNSADEDGLGFRMSVGLLAGAITDNQYLDLSALTSLHNALELELPLVNASSAQLLFTTHATDALKMVYQSIYASVRGSDRWALGLDAALMVNGWNVRSLIPAVKTVFSALYFRTNRAPVTGCVLQGFVETPREDPTAPPRFEFHSQIPDTKSPNLANVTFQGLAEHLSGELSAATGNWTVARTVTGTAQLALHGVAPLSSRPFRVEVPARGATPGGVGAGFQIDVAYPPVALTRLSVVAALDNVALKDLTMSVRVSPIASSITCGLSEKDVMWGARCPLGWLTVGADGCVDPGQLTCAQFAEHFGREPRSAEVARYFDAQCGGSLAPTCATLRSRWGEPGVNATWRQRHCWRSTNASAANPCHQVVRLPDGDIAARQALARACPTARWPCVPLVSAHVSASVTALFLRGHVSYSLPIHHAAGASPLPSVLPVTQIALNGTRGVVRSGALDLSDRRAPLRLDTVLDVIGANVTFSGAVSVLGPTILGVATNASATLADGIRLSGLQLTVTGTEALLAGQVAYSGNTFDATTSAPLGQAFSTLRLFLGSLPSTRRDVQGIVDLLCDKRCPAAVSLPGPQKCLESLAAINVTEDYVEATPGKGLFVFGGAGKMPSGLPVHTEIAVSVRSSNYAVRVSPSLPTFTFNDLVAGAYKELPRMRDGGIVLSSFAGGEATDPNVRTLLTYFDHIGYDSTAAAATDADVGTAAHVGQGRNPGRGVYFGGRALMAEMGLFALQDFAPGQSHLLAAFRTQFTTHETNITFHVALPPTIHNANLTFSRTNLTVTVPPRASAHTTSATMVSVVSGRTGLILTPNSSAPAAAAPAAAPGHASFRVMGSFHHSDGTWVATGKAMDRIGAGTAEVVGANLQVTLDDGKPRAVLVGHFHDNGLSLGARVRFPARAGADLTARVDSIAVHGGELRNVTLEVGTDGTSALSGAFVFRSPNGTNVTVGVAGRLGPNNALYASASLSELYISPSLSLRDISVSILPSHVTWLNGTLDTNIGSVSAAITLPFEELIVGFEHFDLGHGLLLPHGRITVLKGGDVRVDGELQVQARGGFTFKVDGAFDTDGAFRLGGSLEVQTAWRLPDSVRPVDVRVNLTKAARTSPVGGTIYGELDIFGVLVDILVRLPLQQAELDVDVPTLRLSDEVVLHDVQLDLARSGYVAVRATCDVETGAASPLRIAVHGAVTNGSFTVGGSLEDWRLHAGRVPFDLRDVTLAYTKDAAGARGAITANTTLGATELAARVAFPEPSGRGVVFTLEARNPGTRFTNQGIVAELATVSAAHPPATVAGLFTHSLEEFTLEVTTQPPTFNATGKVLALHGADQIASELLIRQDARDNSTWGFVLTVELEAFPATEIYPSAAAAGFPDLKLTDGGVRIAVPASVPAVGAFGALPSEVRTADSVVIFGYIEFAYLETRFAPARLWAANQSHAEDLLAWASFDFDAAAGQEPEFALSVTLPDDLPLGPDVLINNGTVRISSQEPKFDLRVAMTVTLGNLEPLALEGSIAEQDGRLAITGDAIEHYHVRVGSHGIEASEVGFHGSVGTDGAGFSGYLAGVAELVGVDFALKASFPTPNGVELQFSIEDAAAPALTFASLAAALADLEAPLPTFGGVASHVLFDVQLTVFTRPVSVSIAASARGLFGVSEQLAAVLQLNNTGTDLAFAFGVAVGTGFHLSDVDDEWKGLATLPQMLSGGIIVASHALPFTFPDSAPIAAVPGVTVFGNFPLTGHLEPVGKALGVTDVKILGDFDLQTRHLHIAGSIATDWHIGDFLYVQQVALFVDLPGTIGQGAFDIGVSGYFGIRVGKAGLPHNQITVDGKLIVSAVGFTLAAGLDTPWQHPFGLKGVEIYDTEVELGLSFASFAPYLFGLSGGLRIDSYSGNATVFVSLTDPTDFVLAASINHFSLSTLVDALTDNTIPPKISREVFAVGFEGLDLSVNLDPAPLTFNHQTFPSGFIFEIAEFQLWFLEGSCTVKVLEHPASVYLRADVQPFELAGGAVEVSGLTEAGAAKGPLELLLSLGTTPALDAFVLSADARFLHVMDVGFDLNISAAAGFNIAMKYELQPLFDFTLQLQLAGGTDHRDFGLYADLGLLLPQHLEAKIKAFVEAVKARADAAIDRAQGAVNTWEAHNKAKVAQEQAEIRAKTAAINAKRSAKEQELNMHILALHAAQTPLQQYNREKQADEQAKETCKHWYDVGCHLHNAGEDAKIVWVDTKIAFYKAKVDLEEAYFKAKGFADNVEADIEKILSPELDALRVLVGVHEVELKTNATLHKALDVAKGVTNAFLTAVLDVTEAIFSVRNITLRAGSIAGLAKGEAASLQVQGVFLDKPYDVTIPFEFPPSFDSVAKSLWTEVKKIF